MNRLFDLRNWQPTHPDCRDDWRSFKDLPELAAKLPAQTRAIIQHPYDPALWLRRSGTLTKLKYPELAAGDAHKALLLACAALATLHDRPHMRLGHRMGFWMVDEDAQDLEDEYPHAYDDEDDDGNDLEERLANLQASAHCHLNWNLALSPTYEEGRYLQRPYPWTEDHHTTRGDDLLEEINAEFATALSKERAAGATTCERPGCIVKRHAFGEFSAGEKSSADVLGVFATSEIPTNTKLLVDVSRIWGCTGPGLNGSRENLHGGLGCTDPIHPNFEWEDADTSDLRWIRDRAGKGAGDVIVRCRLLISSIRAGVMHPLDHTFIQRLTPTYRMEKVRLFSVEEDLAIQNECLQQFGVDIFANHNYDVR
jgi:hypothetical protein